MGVNYFSCKNCGEATTDYDLIYCTNCESELCSCSMPKELKELCNCWDSVWYYVGVDKDNNIQPNANCTENYTELFRKYLTYTNRYGFELKEEYCPICQRRKEMEKDPEYKEYLRLKAKFDNY